jgi:tRNA 2-(methylsulfanyl)-N6-isopentenyladenosine37 hydroxylase
MLGLKLRTDPRWVHIVAANIQDILTDHAWCEQKAATNAISLITQNPGHPELVTDLLLIAKEEISHFEMVHEIIKARGLTLGREQKDEYVNDLFKFMKKDGSRQSAFTDRLLFAALIEARSCERFRVLSENLQDPELAKFYKDLMVSEANHFTLFLGYAKKYGKPGAVENRWNEWLDFEDSIITNYGKKETVHG